jgi:hypothetical protein
VVKTDGSLNGSGLTAANQVLIQFPPSTWVSFTTDNPVNLYFTLADFTASANGFKVTSTTPFSGPFGIARLWMRAVAADATVQIMLAVKGGGD